MTSHEIQSHPLITGIQRVAEATHGIITPANVLDVIAMGAAAWAAPRLDTIAGYMVSAGAYGADWVDGPLSRWTKTSSKVGYYLDHVIGDKPKTFYALYHIGKMGLADNSVIAAAGIYNTTTAAITMYDRAVNRVPQVDVGPNAKRAFWGTSMALGVQSGANLLAKRNPDLAKKIRLGGLALGFGSFIGFGIPAIKEYASMANAGPKRYWVEWLSSHTKLQRQPS